MGQSITVTLSDTLMDGLQRVATLRHEDLNQVVEDLLAQALPASLARIQTEEQTTEAVNGQPNQQELTNGKSARNIDPEVAAYYVLHPMLWKMYPHQYVALYQGKLVDHDPDSFALSLRIYQHYPNQFVLIRQVEEQAETILRIRSPRLVEDNLL